MCLTRTCARESLSSPPDLYISFHYLQLTHELMYSGPQCSHLYIGVPQMTRIIARIKQVNAASALVHAKHSGFGTCSCGFCQSFAYLTLFLGRAEKPFCPEASSVKASYQSVMAFSYPFHNMLHERPWSDYPQRGPETYVFV